MSVQTVSLAGRQYVIMPKGEYDRWQRRGLQAAPAGKVEPDEMADALPSLPLPGPDGTYPAVATGRVLLARKLIQRRWALGWPQAKLARAAGIRPETLCRIEKCHVTPDMATINKIVTALNRAER
ncbi:MAG: helix-turn-helix domain-containing protein [Phycisphaerae bacterium]